MPTPTDNLVRHTYVVYDSFSCTTYSARCCSRTPSRPPRPLLAPSRGISLSRITLWQTDICRGEWQLIADTSLRLRGALTSTLMTDCSIHRDPNWTRVPASTRWCTRSAVSFMAPPIRGRWRTPSSRRCRASPSASWSSASRRNGWFSGHVRRTRRRRGEDARRPGRTEVARRADASGGSPRHGNSSGVRGQADDDAALHLPDATRRLGHPAPRRRTPIGNRPSGPARCRVTKASWSRVQGVLCPLKGI
jgi:hypothetical protein